MNVRPDQELSFRYMAITDPDVCPEPIASRVNRLIDIGVPCIQLRDKTRSDRTAMIWMSSITNPTHSSILVNSRPDRATVLGADGLHRSRSTLGVPSVRNIFASDCLIGTSTHTPEQVQRAQQLKNDYVTFGPVFPTESHPDLGPEDIPGLSGLSKVCERFDIPVFALGGVTARNLSKCLEAGAYGGAGIRALFETAQPKARWKQIKSTLSSS